jgi:NCAIR mutase (PurE)-related protein
VISAGGETKKKGHILILSAGTSDIPVAEEASVTASFLGSRVESIYDVGVAGIHRLQETRKSIDSARVLIVVAGMEGALPSVVGGLTDKPVIAVPTSIGYGTSFSGLTAPLCNAQLMCARYCGSECRQWVRGWMLGTQDKYSLK